MSSNDAIIPRVKQSVACLSQWQLSRWGLQLLDESSVAACTAHVAMCADCAARWNTERQAIEAARTAPLPAALRQAIPARSAMSQWRWQWSLALAACTAVALFFVRPPLPDVLVKGHAGLMVAVLHHGTVTESPIEDVGLLIPGDALRLRAPSTQPTWQRLQVQRNGEWVDLFVGEVEPNGFVPLGLTVNHDEPSDLRLVVCAEDPHTTSTDVPPGCQAYAARF